MANVYLYYVFDLWAERWRRREARGHVILVRYADDIVAGFQYEADARRFWEAMRVRFEQVALALHPDKTRVLEFGRFAASDRQKRGLGKPETFTFLGFVYICGKTRQGHFQLQRKTPRDRMRARLRAVKEQLRRRMHEPIPVQGAWLKRVVRGFFAYHAVPTNWRPETRGRFHLRHCPRFGVHFSEPGLQDGPHRLRCRAGPACPYISLAMCVVPPWAWASDSSMLSISISTSM